AQEPVRAPERICTIETPLYRAVLGSNGGEMKAWELNYRGVKPMVVDGLLGLKGMEISRAGMPAQVVSFSVSPEELRLGGQITQGSVKLTGADAYGLEVTEVLQFHSDSYLIRQEVSVSNRHSVQQSAALVLPWVTPVEWPKDTVERFQGQRPVRVVKSNSGAVTREDVHKLVDHVGSGQGIALESEWYVAAVIPRGPHWQLSERRGAERRMGAKGKQGGGKGSRSLSGRPSRLSTRVRHGVEESSTTSARRSTRSSRRSMSDSKRPFISADSRCLRHMAGCRWSGSPC